MNSYFDENMKLLDDENLDALFSPSPVYTKIRDDTHRYINAPVQIISWQRTLCNRGRSRKLYPVPRCKNRKGARVKTAFLCRIL